MTSTVTHRLLFGREVPGSSPTPNGFEVTWNGTAVMGILNVTPDSFSDGGEHVQAEAAVEHALAMVEAGAQVIDIGGESTRPGAAPVSVEAELERVLPPIRQLADIADSGVLISIDTCKPEVAHEALKAGAHLVNDVTGLKNPEMITVCAEAGASAVIMHMQGEPRTMQADPVYEDVVAEVAAFLRRQADEALARGVPSVVLDPGFGFGKTVAHNLALVKHLDKLTEVGHPVLLGASRKSSLGKLTGVSEAAGRDFASVALHLYGAQRGAAMLRVHNVPAHVQALKVWEALA